MYLIIDTETNGLPITRGFNDYYPYTDNTKYNSARLVQLSWRIIDEQFNEVCFKDFIIKRDRFKIKNSQFHGITNEISDQKGQDFNDVIEIFYNDLKRCSLIIAHCLVFDLNILLNHCYRYNKQNIIDELNNKEQFCTMENSMKLLKIPNPRGSGFKCPSLNELHNYYFKKNVENAHNAYYDVLACSNCFIKLYEIRN
jgi:DNA polymerase III epsilon subunit-like protein